MAQTNIVREDVLTNVGGTITYAYNDNVQTYVLTGSATLGGNWTITSSGGDVKGTIYNIRYLASMTLSSYNITIFGVALNASQALKQAFISVYYDGSAYQVNIDPDFQDSEIVTTSNIVNGAVTTAKLDTTSTSEAVTTATIRDLNVTTAKIAAGAVTTAKLDNTGGSEAVTTATIRDLNVTSAKIAALAVTTAKIDNAAVTTTKIAAGAVDVANLSASAIALLSNCGIRCAKVTVSSAELLNLFTVPKQLIAAPGVGYTIDVLSCDIRVRFVSAAYVANTTLYISQGPIGNAQFQDQYSLLLAADGITKAVPTLAPSGLQDNTAVRLMLNTGNTTTGDSPIDVYILYRIITL